MTKERTYTNVHMDENGGSTAKDTERKQRFGEPWRPQTMIEDNPIGLPEEAVARLIPKLDEAQATLWVMYHQYHKHHWLVEGPQFRDLHLFLEENYEAIHKHVDALAERMTALGGIPTADPVNQARLSYVEHEPEGTYRIRHMLQHDIEAERRIAVMLRQTVNIAIEMNDHGTKHLLEEVLAAAEDRAHHLDHFLGEDTLEVGLTAKPGDIQE